MSMKDKEIERATGHKADEGIGPADYLHPDGKPIKEKLSENEAQPASPSEVFKADHEADGHHVCTPQCKKRQGHQHEEEGGQ